VRLQQNQGSEQSGTRPCIIVSNDISNCYSSIAIMIPLSTKKDKKSLPQHVTLKKQNYSFLAKDSIALTEQIRVIDKGRLIDKIGEVTEQDYYKIIKSLNINFKITEVKR
jgi:mRNA interferase MazF